MPSHLLPSTSRSAKLCLALLATCLIVASRHQAARAVSAESIYQQKCAGCHGTDGGGVAGHYDGPLYGHDSLAELTERIAKTMPENDPESCVGEEARAVAEFIYHKFYSHEARLANGLIAAPRVELSRLTVPQYRNAVADLVAAFTRPPRDTRDASFREDQPGLLARYYQSEKMNKREKLQLTRIDPAIDFDFADGSPDEKITPDAFAIVWKGSFEARDTGYYDFRIVSPNGVRLYVNTDESKGREKLRDDDSARIRERLIDGWVSSTEERTLSGRIFLLGGRRYPIRLEFFKYQEPTASVRLEWKPPHRVWSVLDDEALSTTPATRTFVVDTPFPPDDRSIGYERGSSVSQEWHTAVTNAAMATADEILERLPMLSGVGSYDEDRSAKLTQFARRFARTAFRRPLTDDEDELYGKTLFHDVSPESAVRRAVLLMLTSPHFLYADLTPVDEPPTRYTIASRLALAVWDSLPDKDLLRAARLDRLSTPKQITTQAEWMLDDPRTRAKIRGFFRHWLELEERDLAKDKQMYPEFDEAVIADLRRSLELFVERVVWSPSSDYRELLQADYLLLNDRLRRLYGNSQSTEAQTVGLSDRFTTVADATEGRSGILTHPYLLSAFAYHNNTSPIHRGVFLTRNIVGRQLKPPPVDVAFENSDFAPDLTMREKVTELTRDQACLSCHEVINPLGFALENFDAVGRWRNSENDKPIDPQSDYTSEAGTTLTISSARDIADYAVASPTAHRAFVRQLFQHMVRQNPDAYSPELIEELREAFVADDFHIRRLIVRIATRAAAHNPATPNLSAGLR